MSEGLVKTKGTRIYFTNPFGASSDDPDGVKIHKVYCPTELQNIGGGAKPKIPTTCLDSERQEYVGGLADNEELSIPFNVAFRSEAYQALVEMFEEGDEDNLSSFQIVYAGATAPDAIDSDGMLVSKGPVTDTVMGYIANLTRNVGANEIVRGTITIQTSGSWAHDYPHPDLP